VCLAVRRRLGSGVRPFGHDGPRGVPGGKMRRPEMNRNRALALLLAALAVTAACKKEEAKPAAAAGAAQASPGPSMSEDEKAVMAFGGAVGQQLAQQVKALNLSPAELEILKKGITASLAGEKPQYDMQQYAPLLQARAEKQAAAAAAPAKEMAAAFRE